MFKYELRLFFRLGGVEKYSVEDCILKCIEIEGIWLSLCGIVLYWLLVYCSSKCNFSLIFLVLLSQCESGVLFCRLICYGSKIGEVDDL